MSFWAFFFPVLWTDGYLQTVHACTSQLLQHLNKEHAAWPTVPQAPKHSLSDTEATAIPGSFKGDPAVGNLHVTITHKNRTGQTVRKWDHSKATGRNPAGREHKQEPSSPGWGVARPPSWASLSVQMPPCKDGPGEEHGQSDQPHKGFLYSPKPPSCCSQFTQHTFRTCYTFLHKSVWVSVSPLRRILRV